MQHGRGFVSTLIRGLRAPWPTFVLHLPLPPLRSGSLAPAVAAPRSFSAIAAVLTPMALVCVAGRLVIVAGGARFGLLGAALRMRSAPQGEWLGVRECWGHAGGLMEGRPGGSGVC